MVPLVYVKVVGFTDVERHALNTVFRLSRERKVSYTLWTPDSPVAPHLGLFDCDSYAARLELESPAHNPHLKLICVGANAPEDAWLVLDRPLDWSSMLFAMDALFVLPPSQSQNAALEVEAIQDFPPGVKLSLLVDASAEHRLYLRARLALAGLYEVEDAVSGAQALEMAHKRRYDLVIVSLDMPDVQGWKLVEKLVALEPQIGRVVLTTSDASWLTQEQAEQAGCFAVLTRPFDPVEIVSLLQKI